VGGKNPTANSMVSGLEAQIQSSLAAPFLPVEIII
jgi:hypothetical protein